MRILPIPVPFYTFSVSPASRCSIILNAGFEGPVSTISITLMSREMRQKYMEYDGGQRGKKKYPKISSPQE